MTGTSASRPARGRVEVGGEVAYIAAPSFGRSRGHIQTPTVIASTQKGNDVV